MALAYISDGMSITGSIFPINPRNRTDFRHLSGAQKRVFKTL